MASNSYVAIFDVLGFKTLRRVRGTDKLHLLYRSALLPSIQHSAAMASEAATLGGKEVVVPKRSSWSVDYVVFSDSILFFTNGDSLADFLRILTASYNLLCSGFSGAKAPLRGAIGHGDLVVADGVFVGTAIEDAYAGEVEQVWSGCALTPDCRKYAEAQGHVDQSRQIVSDEAARYPVGPERDKLLKGSKRIVEYPVPTQRNPRDESIAYSSRPGYVLDWTLSVFEGAALTAFLEPASQHAQRVTKNTIDFEDWARQRLSAE